MLRLRRHLIVVIEPRRAVVSMLALWPKNAPSPLLVRSFVRTCVRVFIRLNFLSLCDSCPMISLPLRSPCSCFRALYSELVGGLTSMLDVKPLCWSNWCQFVPIWWTNGKALSSRSLVHPSINSGGCSSVTNSYHGEGTPQLYRLGPYPWANQVANCMNLASII